MFGCYACCKRGSAVANDQFIVSFLERNTYYRFKANSKVCTSDTVSKKSLKMTEAETVVKKSLKMTEAETVVKKSLKMTEAETVRMLELYRTEPCLYDINIDSYRNRDMRATAAKRISELLNIAGFGPNEIIKKFKNLRNAYSQEIKKIKDSEVSGAGTSDVYTPTVYWFGIMDSFLRPHIYARNTKSNMVIKNKLQETTEDTGEIDDNEDDVETEVQNIDDSMDTNNESPSILVPTITSEVFSSAPTSKSKIVEKRNVGIPRKCVTETIVSHPTDGPFSFLENKRKKIPPKSVKNLSSDDSHLTAAVNKLSEISQTAAALCTAKPQDDMYDNFGKYIASVLRSMDNPKKAIQIQQKLTNVLINSMYGGSDNDSNSCLLSRTPSAYDETSRPTVLDMDTDQTFVADEVEYNFLKY